MKNNLPDFSKARYFDMVRNWRRIRPFFTSRDATRIWKACFVERNQLRAEENGFPYKQKEGRFPADFDGCDWRCSRIGRSPEFWNFVCHAACHWVADMCLFVAKTAYPKVAWRITTSSRNHTTVWNGDRKKPLLFDVNFLALGVKPSEALKLACKGRELKPGKYLKPYLHHAP